MRAGRQKDFLCSMEAQGLRGMWILLIVRPMVK
jgi:hypothetical protein